MKFYQLASALLGASVARAGMWMANDQKGCYSTGNTEFCMFHDLTGIELREPKVYYDGLRIEGNTAANSGSYEVQKFTWVKTADPEDVVMRIHTYGNSLFFLTADDDVKATMEHSDVGICNFKLFIDSVFDLSKAFFKCPDMQFNTNFACTKIEAGFLDNGNPPGDRPKRENWVKMDTSNDLMVNEYSSECTLANGNPGKDEFICEYDPDYYDVMWVHKDNVNPDPVCD